MQKQLAMQGWLNHSILAISHSFCVLTCVLKMIYDGYLTIDAMQRLRGVHF
jgi:hypothetical protein